MPARRPLSVLWLIKGLGPGGSERLLVAAAEAHDPAIVSLTCAFVVATKDHLADDLERLGVRCICLSPTGSPTWPFTLRRLLRRQRFDVVHVHGPLPGSVARLAIRMMPATARPVIVSTEHNAQSTYAWPVRWLNSLTSRWDDARFAVSDEARTSLGRRTRERTNVLVHGINLSKVAAQAGERLAVRREFGLDDDEMIVGTVANFRRQKDYPNLLNAAAILRSRGVQMRWLIVGQGPLEHETRELASMLKLDDVVIFTGFRADATRVMSAFDLFVLSSKGEGLPVALMEALTIGLPIVATSVGGVAQVLINQQDALLVPRKNALALARAVEQALLDPVLRRRLAHEGQALAASFDIRRTTAALEATYIEATATVGTTPAPEPAPTRARTRVTRTVPSNTPRGPWVNDIDIRPATMDDRDGILSCICGPLGWGDDPRNPDFFAWKHDQNPFGASPGWVALDGDRVVGARMFMQWRFQRGEQTLRVARAVDTAVDPGFRGRGVFSELTRRGVDALTEDGVDFIFNTPNDHSRPGYLKLGWTEVGRIPVAMRPRLRQAPRLLTANGAAQRWSQACTIGTDVGTWLDHGGAQRLAQTVKPEVRTLSTPIEQTYLRWRYGQTLVPYRVVENGDAAIIIRVRVRGRATELAMALSLGDPAAADRLLSAALEETGCTYALRIGAPDRRHGFVPIPIGPHLTWRGLSARACPPLANWGLALGDVELM